MFANKNEIDKSEIVHVTKDFIIQRKEVNKAALWSVPVIASAIAVPTATASPGTVQVHLIPDRAVCCRSAGTAAIAQDFYITKSSPQIKGTINFYTAPANSGHFTNISQNSSVTIESIQENVVYTVVALHNYERAPGVACPDPRIKWSSILKDLGILPPENYFNYRIEYTTK